MNDAAFTTLDADECADINGGYAWIAIAAATVILVAKECITHYEAFENGVVAGYHDATR